jgi:hypothetical protein
MNPAPFVSIAHFVKSNFGMAPMKKTTTMASDATHMNTVKRKLATTPTKFRPTKIA